MEIQKPVDLRPMPPQATRQLGTGNLLFLHGLVNMQFDLRQHGNCYTSPAAAAWTRNRTPLPDARRKNDRQRVPGICDGIRLVLPNRFRSRHVAACHPDSAVIVTPQRDRKLHMRQSATGL